jgi:hypothetical protein
MKSALGRDRCQLGVPSNSRGHVGEGRAVVQRSPAPSKVTTSESIKTPPTYFILPRETRAKRIPGKRSTRKLMRGCSEATCHPSGPIHLRLRKGRLRWARTFAYLVPHQPNTPSRELHLTFRVTPANRKSLHAQPSPINLASSECQCS